MSVIDSFKTAKDLVIKVHNAEIKSALQSALLDAQGAALELQEKVAKLQEENERLREQLRKREEAPADLKSINGIWWGNLTGELLPLCPRCSPDKWIPLELNFRWADGRIRDDGEFMYECGACDFRSVRNLEDERSKGAVLEPPSS